MVQPGEAPAPPPGVSPAIVIGGFLTLIVVVLFAAFVLDARRTVLAYDRDLAVADGELRAQEDRFLAVANQTGTVSESLSRAIGAYRAAQGTAARHEAFQVVLGAAGTAAPENPEDPIARRRADELAGSMNRWQVEYRRYRAVEEDATRFRGTVSGSVGGAFSWIPLFF